MGAQLSNLSDYIMNKLTNIKDIKKYCIDTIKHGNGKRIQLVLKRYWKILEDSKNSAEIVEFAQKLFT